MALRVDDLRVYYRTLRGEVKALDGVSFAVADGEGDTGEEYPLPRTPERPMRPMW